MLVKQGLKLPLSKALQGLGIKVLILQTSMQQHPTFYFMKIAMQENFTRPCNRLVPVDIVFFFIYMMCLLLQLHVHVMCIKQTSGVYCAKLTKFSVQVVSPKERSVSFTLFLKKERSTSCVTGSILGFTCSFWHLF